MSNTNYHCTRTKDGKIMFFANGKRVRKDRYIEIAGELDEQTCLTGYERKQLIKMAIQSIGKIRDRENRLLEECHSSLRDCNNRVEALENELKVATEKLVGNQVAEDQKLRDEIVRLNGLLQSETASKEDAMSQLVTVRRELEQQITELISKIQELESVNTQYKQENSDLLSREGEMKNEISDLKNQIKTEQDKFVVQTGVHETSIDQTIDDMLSILNGVLDEKIELKQIFDKYGTNVRKADVVKQILDKFSEIRGNITELQNAKVALDAAVSSNAQKDSRIAALETELRESQEECAKQTDILRTRVSELEVQNSRVTNELQSVNSKLVELESSTKQLTAEYLDKKATMESVINSLNAEKAQLNLSFDELKALKERDLISSDELKDLRAQRDKNIKELSELEAKLLECDGVRADLKEEKLKYEQLNAKNMEIQSQLDEISSKYSELESNSNAEKLKYNELQSRYDELVQSSSMKTQEYEQQKSELETKYNNLTEKINDMQSETSTSRQRLSELERELSMSKDSIQQLIQDKGALKNEVDATQKLRFELVNQLNVEKDNLKQTEEKRQLLAAAATQKDKDIEDLENQIKSLKSMKVPVQEVPLSKQKVEEMPEQKVEEIKVEEMPEQKVVKQDENRKWAEDSIMKSFNEINGVMSDLEKAIDSLDPSYMVEENKRYKHLNPIEQLDAPQILNRQNRLQAYNEFVGEFDKYIEKVFTYLINYTFKVGKKTCISDKTREHCISVLDSIKYLLSAISLIMDRLPENRKKSSSNFDVIEPELFIQKNIPCSTLQTILPFDEDVRKKLNETWRVNNDILIEILPKNSDYRISPLISDVEERYTSGKSSFKDNLKGKFEKYLGVRQNNIIAFLGEINNLPSKQKCGTFRRFKSFYEKMLQLEEKYNDSLSEIDGSIRVNLGTFHDFNELYNEVEGKCQSDVFSFGYKKKTSRVKRVKRSKGKSGKKKRTSRKSRV